MQFYISYYMVDKRPETAAICPNKQFWHKIHFLFLPSSQEEINKVIFVWVYELENSNNNKTSNKLCKNQKTM